MPTLIYMGILAVKTAFQQPKAVKSAKPG